MFSTIILLDYVNNLMHMIFTMQYVHFTEIKSLLFCVILDITRDVY